MHYSLFEEMLVGGKHFKYKEVNNNVLFKIVGSNCDWRGYCPPSESVKKSPNYFDIIVLF